MDLELLSPTSASPSAASLSDLFDGLDGLDGSFDDGLLAGLLLALGLDGGLLVKNRDLLFGGGDGFVLGGLGGIFLFTDESVTSNPSCMMAPGTGRRGPT